MKTINEFCEELRASDPSTTDEVMLHALHEAGYQREESTQAIRKFYTVTLDRLCQLLVGEYTHPPVSKTEVTQLLTTCIGKEVEDAVKRSYPKSLGFVMMIDVSGSMDSWINTVKIDAKALVRCARVYDQFAVNQFHDDASWIYPTGSNPDMLTVTDGLAETKQAVTEIEKLTTIGCTNIREAINLGNRILQKSTSTTDIKAFVLLSDGEHNAGGADPETVLGTEIPIYIAGLGQYMNVAKLEKLKAKNSKSRFYNTPNAFEVMQMLNQILADASESTLSLNKYQTFTAGNDYLIQPFTVASGGMVTVSLVWNNIQFRYTAGQPSGNLVNIFLIDPKDQTLKLAPDADDPGNCTFHLSAAQPGQWKVLVQYNTQESAACTISVRENTPIHTEILAPDILEQGEKLPLSVHVWHDETMLTDCRIQARISRPAQVVDMSEMAVGEEVNNLLLPTAQNHSCLDMGLVSAGSYSMEWADTSVPGVYNIELTIEGTYPQTNQAFTALKRYALVVE